MNASFILTEWVYEIPSIVSTTNDVLDFPQYIDLDLVTQLYRVVLRSNCECGARAQVKIQFKKYVLNVVQIVEASFTVKTKINTILPISKFMTLFELS